MDKQIPTQEIVDRRLWFYNWAKSKYPRIYKEFLKIEESEKEIKGEHTK